MGEKNETPRMGRNARNGSNTTRKRVVRGEMEGVYPARMAKPCGYVEEEEETGTRRPSYEEELTRLPR